MVYEHLKLVDRVKKYMGKNEGDLAYLERLAVRGKKIAEREKANLGLVELVCFLSNTPFLDFGEVFKSINSPAKVSLQIQRTILDLMINFHLEPKYADPDMTRIFQENVGFVYLNSKEARLEMQCVQDAIVLDAVRKERIPGSLGYIDEEGTVKNWPDLQRAVDGYKFVFSELTWAFKKLKLITNKKRLRRKAYDLHKVMSPLIFQKSPGDKFDTYLKMIDEFDNALDYVSLK